MSHLKIFAEPKSKAPVDRWNIVFFTLVLHGIGTLTPWNMFITAKQVNKKLLCFFQKV